MSLKNALGSMVALHQFIVFNLKFDTTKNKYEKFPIHVQSPQYPATASDPKNWMPFDVAHQWVNYLNSTVANPYQRYAQGFYFTPGCGYWFLDIDDAIVDGKETQVATHLKTVLNGAAFEVSSSQHGYHFFGRGTLPVNRQIKPANTGLELYTEKRAVCFGLSGQASGNADVDCAEVMSTTVCPIYFPPHSAIVDINQHDYLSGPRIDWHGPSDDTELLRRMRRSSSMQGKFSPYKANFSDLYDGNFEVLKKIYKKADGSFDESAADYALASHLAFWTGCDAQRIERFMRQSALYRPKWDDHKSYLMDFTIAGESGVCNRQTNVLRDKKLMVIDNVIEPVLNTDKIIADEDDQKILFNDCVYVSSEHKISMPLPNGEFQLLSNDQFNAWFARYIFKINVDSQSGAYIKKAFEAFLSSKLVVFPTAHKLKFNPFIAPKKVFVEDGVKYLNTYSPTPIFKEKGDVTLFIQLLDTLFPDGKDKTILLSWMAACVQHPGKKFRWAIILQGVQGCGKTLITQCLAYAIGKQFCVAPDPKNIIKQFNGWLEGKFLIVINEVKQFKDYKEIEGSLKKLISDNDVEIEPKNKEQRSSTNYANFIFTLNDKNDFKKYKGDRRFCMLYSKPQDLIQLNNTGLTSAFFVDFLNWLNDENGYGQIAQFLHDYHIPDEFNPATRCIVAPDTSSENEVNQMAKSTYEMMLVDAIQESGVGFKNGWVCFQRAKNDVFNNKLSPMQIERILSDLGYFPHPALNEKGWTDNPVLEEFGKRVRLYCTENVIKITKNLARCDISRKYVVDQM